MNSINIMIVEDDNDIHQMLKELLTNTGYKVTSAYSGTEAILQFKVNQIDLILLDYMLPGMTGDQVLSEIRNQSHIPIIALTAIDDKSTIVAMLKNGANDYIFKPFDNDILKARIEVQLRHEKKIDTNNQFLIYKTLKLDKEQFEGFIDTEPLNLSKKEYEILQLLMEHPKKVYTKNNLYETVWKEEFFGDDNTINVHISNIRAKIAKYRPNDKYIQTVWGIGFKMVDEA